MEHRSHKRVSVCRDICVEYPGGKAVAGTVRNASRSGAFVELCTNDLPPHALVQLRLPAGGDSRHAFIRVPAAITRRTHGGVGLLYYGRYEHVPDPVLA